MATVPNVLDLTVEEANSKLSEVGFQWDFNGPHRPGDVVVAQDPGPKAKVPLETTTVELTFGRSGNGHF
jgi:beta-lactam-binding protein with PASTA domain